MTVFVASFLTSSIICLSISIIFGPNLNFFTQVTIIHIPEIVNAFLFEAKQPIDSIS